MDFETFDRYTCFGAIVDDPIVRCPEREAIIFGDWRVTYGQRQGAGPYEGLGLSV